jgi:hypothetical protein
MDVGLKMLYLWELLFMKNVNFRTLMVGGPKVWHDLVVEGVDFLLGGGSSNVGFGVYFGILHFDFIIYIILNGWVSPGQPKEPTLGILTLEHSGRFLPLGALRYLQTTGIHGAH